MTDKTFYRLLDLDFEKELKKARRYRECSYIVNEMLESLIDNRWLTIEKTNIFGDTHILSNVANNPVQTFTVMPSMYSNVYTVQFYVEEETLVKQSLEQDKKNNIEKLIFHARLVDSDSYLKRLRIRMNSKRYLIFLTHLYENIQETLNGNGIPVAKETVSLALFISYCYANFDSFANSGISENDCIVKFFNLYNSGLHPVLIMKHIVDDYFTEENLKQYSGIPEEWLAKTVDIDLDFFK